MKGLHNTMSTHVIYVAIIYGYTDADMNVIICSFKMARLSNESKKQVMILHLPISQFTVDAIVLSA